MVMQKKTKVFLGININAINSDGVVYSHMTWHSNSRHLTHFIDDISDDK